LFEKKKYIYIKLNYRYPIELLNDINFLQIGSNEIFHKPTSKSDMYPLHM